ncbi:non-ribosomal peptide synthetase [Butyrivibrio sp. YAB3001]|uniref:non-ribosomal peptide synthetase n=1 Tax=Butyrivibrio sp. YAB3001 TaxID=1520812 RepID=UPI0008F668A1|nr:non-ribosomal peptide synthetase [Butyrivibrio sp. YAB3001]SFD03730.1 amino acid adenylation domain-containing protein [Butyrivibrio sp. YAB3001]
MQGEMNLRAYDFHTDYPLSQTQKGILAESLKHPDSTIYNVPALFELSDKIDMVRLKEAVDKAIASHPYLNIRIFADETGNYKVKPGEPPLPEAEIIRGKALPKDLVKPFKLLGGELCRASLFITEDKNYLYIECHHIILDGTSTVLLIDNINKLYNREDAEPETYSGFDVALDEEDERKSPQYAIAKDYYERLLSNVDRDMLPKGDSRSGVEKAGFCKVVSSKLDQRVISTWCKKNKVKKSAFYNAVFSFVLAKYDNKNEAVYTTIYNGRKDARTRRTVAMMVKTLPVVCKFDGNEKVTDFVLKINEQIKNNIANDVFSFVDISRSFGFSSDIMFAYQGDGFALNNVGGEPAKFRLLPVDGEQSSFGITVYIIDGKATFECDYDAGRYSENFMRSFVASMEEAALEFMHRECLNEVSILSADAMAEIRAFNDTAFYVPFMPCHKLFEKQVSEHPDQIAFVNSYGKITFEEVNRRANCIANALLAKGIKLDDTVGILFPRGVDAVCAELGIMKAGGAFLPMLSDYPDDRIDYCMTDSCSKYLLTTDEIYSRRKASFSDKKWTFMPISDFMEEGKCDNPDIDVPSDALAYCIYTSGSTGNPKGVMVEHGNLCNFLNVNPKNNECLNYVSAGDVALSISALSFDVSIMEIWLTLTSGKTLCMALEDEIMNPLQLFKVITSQKVDIITCTPSFLLNILDIPEASEALRGIKLYDIGAEAFPPSLFAKIRNVSPNAVIINGYGPTETTISCLSKMVESSENITIGKPAANVKAWIIDGFGNVLPPFATGELVIGGSGVCRGYMNLPDKTSDVFITIEGDRAYKTGDIARFINGEIEFFGRKDNQIKFHGLRIEPDEIAAVINSYSGINQSCVTVRRNNAGEDILCAYFTAAKQIEVAGLKEFISKKLAHYMVPSSIVQLSDIPTTKNGKIDMSALPEPVISKDELVPPKNDAQKRIFDRVSKVLGHTDFGITTNLYDAGLSSLGAIRLVVLLAKEFEAIFTVHDLRENPTVEAIEKSLLCHGKKEKYEVLDVYPLSQTQQGILAESLWHPDTTIYNIPALYHLSDKVDINRLKAALCKCVYAHPYLSAHLIYDEKGNVLVKRNDDKEPFVEIIETRSLPKDMVRPFKMIGERLYRLKIYVTDAGNYLFMDFHHIIFDGASNTVFMQDINSAYESKEPEKENFTGFDVAVYEEKLRGTERYDRAKAYYENLLADTEFQMLPEGDVYGKTKALGTFCITSEIDTAMITDYCGKHGFSQNAFYNAVFSFVMSKYNYSEDVLYTTIYNGRNDSRLERAVIMLVKTFPVRFKVGREKKITSFVSEVGRQLIDSMDNDIYTFAEISHEHNILPDIIFAYQGETSESCVIAGEPAIECPIFLSEAKAPIHIDVFEKDGKVLFTGEYREDIYSGEYISRLLRCIEKGIFQFLVKERLDEVSLADEHDIEEMDAFNETKESFPESDIVSCFIDVAERFPGNKAVIYKEKEFTYSQVMDISGRIAGALADRGIGKGDVVSVLIPRCEYMPIAALGVLRAGAVLEPLDASYPKDRLSFMIKDAGSKLLIADKDMAQLVPDYSGDMLFICDIQNLPCSDTKEAISLKDLFILLYTSGTTGTPKGVMLEHGNISNFCAWYRDYYKLDENSRVAAYASFGFDACMMDMFPALTVGASVCIMEEEIRFDLVAMEKWFEQKKITHAFLTTQVCRQFYEMTKNSKLKYLSAGGEKLVPVAIDKEQPKLFNGYGPTECTIFSTVMPVTAWYGKIPIGRPISNCKCYVVDKDFNRLPPYVPGELLIAGKGVGRGYLNRPELTKEVFITNPFSENEDYRRAYRSGDIVRLLPDGNLDFIGRNDGQVKVHGYRVELSEVEEVIRKFPGIIDTTVMAYENESSGEKNIAAYIVSDKEVDKTALCDFVREKKPSYMVPGAIIQIERIPLTQNGKVNKNALPKPSASNKEIAGEKDSVVPLNLLEKELKSMVSEILGTSEFGITDLFKHLGLTSISGIRLSLLVYQKYGVQISAQRLISGGSILSVENEILSALLGKKGGKATDTGIKKDSEVTEIGSKSGSKSKKSCRLSFIQEGIYAECQANPGTVQYNMPFALRFPEGIGVRELIDAIYKVICAHPYILSNFVTNADNEIIQEQSTETASNSIFAEVSQDEKKGFYHDIVVTDISEKEIEDYEKSFVRSFDIENGPLVRFEILRADSLILLVDMHHLISDGTSMDIFFRQLCEVLDGKEPEKEYYDYYDYVSDEHINEEDEAYFARQMEEVPEAVMLLPDIYEEKSEHTEKSLNVPTNLKKVKEFAQNLGVTPAAVYLAAVYIVIGRYVCEDNLAIATVSNGRSNVKTSGSMGMFVNTLPLVMSFYKDEKISDFIGRVAKNLSETIEHEKYPFSRLARKYDFHPAVSFAYQIGVINDYHTEKGRVEVKELDLDLAKIPVAIYINGTLDNANITIAYDSALYSEGMMSSLADSMENVVRGLLSCSILSEISLTGPKQWEVLDSYNLPWDLDYDKKDTVVSAFKKTAALFPEKIAAVYKDKSYTYKELDEITDSLAAKIYHIVVGEAGKRNLSEEIVAILVHRNENVFLLPMAVIKAGLAYEPLDPDYPKDRLNFMVNDAGASLLLAEDDLEGIVDEYNGKVLTVSELFSMEDFGVEPCGLSPEDLFIVLYTSGSTGLPKGCQIEHRNMISYAHGVRNDFYTREDRIAAYASFGFDVNMSDVFCTLLNGGTVYLISDEDRMNLDALAAYIEKEGITALLLTTQVGIQFVQNYPSSQSLRMLVVGGEKLPAIDVSDLSYRVVNGYGPTENCCGVSLFPIKKWEPNIPIGKPMATIHGYVLDRTGHRLPQGAAGEYCLSGPQVSRGYLNHLDKTSEVYEKCPFDEFRMYHTGDIVRYRANGDVEFVGRKDGQVKIRGFRVETKEVEAVIRSFDGIRDVTVQAYDYENGGKYLAAFVVSDKAVDISALLQFIKDRKPAYLVPQVIMQIEKIPLTVNMKVDKKALPKPVYKKAGYVAPKGKIQEKICSIFAEALGADKVGAEDDFFELGGSSILAMKVVVAVKKAGYSIVYNDVFKYTTPRAMADYIGAEKKQAIIENIEKKPSESSLSIPENITDDYDYSRIHELLSQNTISAFKEGKELTINDVFLLGATGYLGSHVLYELIENTDAKVYCLVRKKHDKSGIQRLQSILKYYFDNAYESLFDERIFVIEGDATDAGSFNSFKAKSEDMQVINCAASVKHFARENEIERTNVDSVRNIVTWCKENNARLVHISTGSIAGSMEAGKLSSDYHFDEHILYNGQIIDNNQYVHSKFMAERYVYEEILNHGLRAKVLRMGNLAPRLTDGEFQINYMTNNSMNTFRAYGALGMIPYEIMSEQIEFSPIDVAAKAVVLLSKTPDACVCFIPINPHRALTGDVIRCMNEAGYKICYVDTEIFDQKLDLYLSDEKMRDKVSSLKTYETNDNTVQIRADICDNSLTTSVLGRLGLYWPETGEEYIRGFVDNLKQKGYW